MGHGRVAARMFCTCELQCSAVFLLHCEILSVLHSTAPLLRNASHALVASLGSCADRIGDRGASCKFESVDQGLFSFVFGIVVEVFVLACPALELFIAFEE